MNMRHAGVVQSLCFFFGQASTTPAGLDSSFVASLYANGTDELDETFKAVYGHFEKTFDSKLYGEYAGLFGKGVDQYRTSDAYNAYRYAPTAPHCDKGVAVAAPPVNVHGMSAFPGGAVGRVFAFDFGKHLFDLSQEAEGPAAAGLIAPMALASQALATGMGLVQSTIASALHVVPPLIPPPMWNNQPLTTNGLRPQLLWSRVVSDHHGRFHHCRCHRFNVGWVYCWVPQHMFKEGWKDERLDVPGLFRILHEHDVLVDVSALHDTAKPGRASSRWRPCAHVLAYVYHASRDVPWLLDGRFDWQLFDGVCSTNVHPSIIWKPLASADSVC